MAVDKLSSLQPVGLRASVFSWFWREAFVFLSGGAASHGHKSEREKERERERERERESDSKMGVAI